MKYVKFRGIIKQEGKYRECVMENKHITVEQIYRNIKK